MVVFVVDKNRNPLMPTTRYGKVRHLLKEKRAVIERRNPFTIRLLYNTPGITQPVEMCMDTGYEHIGVSVKSEKKEFVSAEYNLLPNEKEQHDSSRKYRRSRRGRKRYRKPRFNNRTSSKKEGWIPPSLKNKADMHIDLIKGVVQVCPVTDVYVEMGSFDTMLLKAIQEGKPVPVGKDYQHGGRYQTDTLRAAVFERDGHKCQFCGRGIKEGAILHVHHAYYWRGQHGSSMDELVTCCEKCHTPSNHQKGGLLYGYDKKLPRYNGSAFMNTVRWYIWNALKGILEEDGIERHMTYGTVTKYSREYLGLEKTHANDAFSMWKFHPENRPNTEYFEKRRRNNRCLEKFYDAKYIDVRDGTKKSGKELSCNRTKRREPRNSEKSLRKYRGQRTSKGRFSVRKKRYPIRPGDIVIISGKKYNAIGVHCNGSRVLINIDGNKKSIAVKKIRSVIHSGGWIKVS